MNTHEVLLQTTEQPKPQTINELLPTYYEALGTNPTYETIRSIDIDGHEVAWMRIDGSIKVDLLGLGREGEPYQEWELLCACDFTQGIGWDIYDGNKALQRITSERCIAKDTAIYMRLLELRHKYQKHKFISSMLDTEIQVEEVVKDLIKKDKAHEFIEAGGGANFYGGHFYLETLAKIMDMSEADIAEIIKSLEANKTLSLIGSVVKEYKEPKQPKWNPYLRQELNGYVATASLPANSDTPQAWKFDIQGSEGAAVDVQTPTISLYYQPLFGPDVQDVDRAQKVLKDLIDSAIATKN